MNKVVENVLATILAVIVIVLATFVAVMIPTAIGALVGFVLTLTPLAGLIVTGLNSVLGTQLLSSSLVSIGAALGFVGSFLKGARPTQKPVQNTVNL